MPSIIPLIEYSALLDYVSSRVTAGGKRLDKGKSSELVLSIIEMLQKNATRAIQFSPNTPIHEITDSIGTESLAMDLEEKLGYPRIEAGDQFPNLYECSVGDLAVFYARMKFRG